MTDRQLLVDQIMMHEGIRLFPYTDAAGKITIGVGRNLTDKGLSSSEVMLLLDHDIDECITDLAVNFPWFAALDVVRERVMVDMRFNLGAAGFRKFTSMIAAVAAGDYVKASEQMLQSRWATQVKTRAQRLARMMATGEAI